MNSKPCAISSTLKSDSIVFRVGTYLHFNNIKIEIKLQHNSVCPWISTSDSPVVRKFRIAISHSCISFEREKIIEIRKYVIRKTEPAIRKRHMQNVENVLQLVPLTWKLSLISICVTIEQDNYSWSPPSLHVQTDRSWQCVRGQSDQWTQALTDACPSHGLLKSLTSSIVHCSKSKANPCREQLKEAYGQYSIV